MISAPIIRRRLSSRRLDPNEIARLDADALRQRRRRADRRSAEQKRIARIVRLRVLSAAMMSVMVAGSLLLAFGWMRLDLGRAMADTPREAPSEATPKANDDPALLTRLDEISKGLVRLESDLSRKPNKTVALAPLERPITIPKKQAVALDDRRLWRASRGSWSSDVLRHWSEQAGVDLDWQAEIDIQLDAPVEVLGSFEEAVTSLLEGFAHKMPHPRGQLHLNRKMGRPALVVVAEGNPDG